MTIIITLSSIGIFVFSQARLSGKDTKRKTDLAEIAQALELYYQANRVYPGTAGTWYSSLNAEPWLPNLAPNFINVLPLDPVQNSTYRYVYLSVSPTSGSPACPNLSNGQFFILGALLETPGDKDSIGVKVVKDCNGASVATYSPFNSSPNWFVLTTP